MTIEKNETVCFSGYRPDKFGFQLHESSEYYSMLLGYINLSIISSIEDGYTTFLCGMAQGFDILCGETVAGLKRIEPSFGHISLIAVLPYKNHGNGQLWNGEWTKRHKDLITRADRVVNLSEKYYQGCFHERNRYMVDNASRLICFWDGKAGGTAHTRGYAVKQGVEVINIAEAFK